MRICLLATLVLLAEVSAPAQDEFQEMYRLFKAGKAEACMKECRALIARHPENPAPYHVLGRLLLGKGDTVTAIKHLSRCLELSPRPAWMTAWTHLALGKARLQSGDKEKARQHLQKAVSLNATRNATEQARALLGKLDREKLPAFRFVDLHGRLLTRASLKGTPVLFKFGPSW